MIAPDAVERGVALQQSREDAFGDDLDARARPTPSISSRVR